MQGQGVKSYGFTVRFYCHCGERWDENLVSKGTSNRTNVRLDVHLKSPLEQSIFEFLQENPKLTVVQMTEKLSVNERTIRRTINALKDKGVIERKCGKRYGYWEVKINQ